MAVQASSPLPRGSLPLGRSTVLTVVVDAVEAPEVLVAVRVEGLLPYYLGQLGTEVVAEPLLHLVSNRQAGGGGARASVAAASGFA